MLLLKTVISEKKEVNIVVLDASHVLKLWAVRELSDIV